MAGGGVQRVLHGVAELAGLRLTLRRPNGREVVAGADPSGADEVVRDLPDGSRLRAQDTHEPARTELLAAALDHVTELLAAQQASEDELTGLADELLGRYEELTLLYDLSRELVAVFDESQACATVLHRAMSATAASYGQVLLVDGDGALTRSAATEGEPPAGPDLAEALAVAAVAARRHALVDRGQDWQGQVAAHAALAVPLSASDDEEVQPLGALVLVGKHEERFTAGEVSLAGTVARHLATALENARLVVSLREKERIELEVELAASLQRQLLPQQPPELAGVTMRAACIPAERVGGDYYDMLRAGDAAIGLVADVSGHGVGPGMMMAMARTALRRELQDGTSLAQALLATNRLLWDDLLATGLFITLFCVRYDPPSRRLSYVNAGHHPAMLRRADGRVEQLDGDGFPLGLVPDPAFEEPSVVLEEGDAVLLFTDGIVEERAPSGEMFGTARLVEVVAGAGTTLRDTVLTAAESYRGGAAQQDDVTLLELRVGGAGT